MIIQGATISGTSIYDKSTGLYGFTSFTFTNANAVNRTGPTLPGLLASYDTGTNSWLNNTNYFNVTTQGIQTWTVPRTGTYQIEVVGAAGGEPFSTNVNTGFGAKMVGNVSLTQGDKINIVVGQRGYPMSPNVAAGAYNAGGGGGSFVFRNITDLVPLMAAGGGGGGTLSAGTNPRANAAVFANGIPGTGYSDSAAAAFSGLVTGANIGQGGINISTTTYKVGAGGGWTTNGQGGHALCTYPVSGGNGGSNANPFLGGYGNNTQSGSLVNNQGGGFGGGGGGTGRCGQSGSGGGGGYTGGSMGTDTNTTPATQRAQGGGSYIDTVNVTTVSTSIYPFLANGYVTVTLIS